MCIFGNLQNEKNSVKSQWFLHAMIWQKKSFVNNENFPQITYEMQWR